SFTILNGSLHERLARLNADGSLDASWVLGANNVVKAIAFDPEGRALVGGAFTEIGGVAQNGIARLEEANASSLATDGDIHLSLQAEAGRKYMLESSSDLKNWQVFGTSIATSDGVSVSANTKAGPRQFFRARVVEE